MRPATFLPRLLSAAAPLALAFSTACGDDNASTPDAGGDSAAAGLDGGGLDAGSQPDAQTCVGDEAGCLFGTAVVGQGFDQRPSQLQASLFRVFPGGGAAPLSVQLVAKDQTWAFSGLDPWGHYYVTIEPGHLADAGVIGEGPIAVLTRVGPLVVPDNSAAPVAIQAKPVQLDVYEQAAPTATLQVETATARVVETTQGGSGVSISIGGSSNALAWSDATKEYLLQFSPPPAAQAAYEMATSPPSNNISTWNLVGDPRSFSVSITAPATTQPSGTATVPANQDLTVSWALQLAADYVEVEVFQQTGTDPQGSPIWGSPVHKPQILSPDVGQEVVKASEIATAGNYLLNVAFTRANCPPTDDGCVHASTVANELLTVK